MDRKIASLNSLRVFESVARHLSFTKAADELRISTAAASQHIKSLEGYYETKLFYRTTRVLALTEEGQAALPLFREGLELMTIADRKLKQFQNKNIIRVSVTPSLAAKWLLPRLKSFRKYSPEIEVRMDATDICANFKLDNVDIAIRYGHGDEGELISEHLLDVNLIPVCSPILRKGEHAIREPKDLLLHTLIHIDASRTDKLTPEWPMWVKAIGLTDVDFDSGPRFNSASIAIDAAVDAQGVLLVEKALIENELLNGSLIQPFSEKYIQDTNFTYRLVYPEGHLSRHKVKVFREWILDQVQIRTQ